jgi:hypothetical protein
MASLAGFRLTRTAVLAALAPLALLAGYFAIRPGPKTAQGASAVQPNRETPLPRVEYSPAQPATASTPATPDTPNGANPAAPMAIGMKPTADPARAVQAVEKAPASGPPRGPRPVNKPQPSLALRVTGGEVVPASTMPAPAPISSEASSVKSEALELPPSPPVPVAVAPAPDPGPAPQDAEPAKPQKGNRLVRAIGKIFKKPNDAGDASKTPAKKD